MRIAMLVGLAALGPMIALAATPAYDVQEKSVAELQADLSAGKISSEKLVQAYLSRIDAIDAHGPSLHSIISLNPNALADARAADRDRRAGRAKGPLFGVPDLVKDNIETGDGEATTAGSLALSLNVASRDAPAVKRLKSAGAIILGKTNLSEWANIRSSRSISGWSGVGGLVKNPYALDRNACGSSSGTGAAIAASLAAVGVGTETNGSITCPSAISGLVGLKPTVGLVSRTQVIPISHSQDTPGPMGRSVADVAALLAALAGSDPADPATATADAHKTDYVAALKGASLKGKRLGVLRYAMSGDAETDRLFERAVAVMRAEGAEIVDIKDFKPPKSLGDDEIKVLLTELKADLNAYLATTPAAVKTRSLADVIAFDQANARELGLFAQDLFEAAEQTSGLADPDYQRARAASLKAAGVDGIDKLIDDNRLDALICPSYGPAWRTDIATGDHNSGRSSTLAAIAGYPHLTTPMGQVKGLPVGISFIGKAWSEAQLLALAFAYERTGQMRKPPTYAGSLETHSEAAQLLAPAK